MTQTNETKETGGVPAPVAGSLLASGFPFQTAVAEAIRKAAGWKVLAEEWPWRDGDADRFIDIVASKGDLTLVVEAKKTDKEVFTFLSDGPKGEVTPWWRGPVLTQIKDSTARMELECRTWAIAPSSPIAKFCVIATSRTGGDQRLLERDAALLMRGTHTYGLRFRRTFRPGQGEVDRPYVSVIVTNAQLFLAEYPRNSISMETGRLEPKDAIITAVDVVRFSKPFVPDRDRDFGDLVVFVVRAPQLGAFLDSVETIGVSMIGGAVGVPSDRS